MSRTGEILKNMGNRYRRRRWGNGVSYDFCSRPGLALQLNQQGRTPSDARPFRQATISDYSCALTSAIFRALDGLAFYRFDLTSSNIALLAIGCDFQKLIFSIKYVAAS